MIYILKPTLFINFGINFYKVITEIIIVEKWCMIKVDYRLVLLLS